MSAAVVMNTLLFTLVWVKTVPVMERTAAVTVVTLVQETSLPHNYVTLHRAKCAPLKQSDDTLQKIPTTLLLLKCKQLLDVCVYVSGNLLKLYDTIENCIIL